MATSAFKSTTKRSSVGSSISNGADDSFGSSSTKTHHHHHHRRSRSLSQFSRRLPTDLELEEQSVADYSALPRGKFVNTVRGSGFPEISLDDLAIEFFSSKDNSGGSNAEERGSSERSRSRLARRGSDVGRWASDTASSKRRGRSVSRHGGGGGGGEAKAALSNCVGDQRGKSEVNPRRRRSVSVARYQISDSESEADHFRGTSSHSDVKNIDKWKKQTFSSQKMTGSGDRRIRKSLSHKDLARLHDGYSSHSSALTDEESKDTCSGKNGKEKNIQAVYTQKRIECPHEDVKNGLYEAMQKELRYAVDEIRTELEQVVVRNNTVLGNDNSSKSDAVRVFSTIQRDYATKLEQSQKRREDLLAEMILEEQRGRELSKIMRELGPDSGDSAAEKKPFRARKRSIDKNRMSKRLSEEAERYFEDFISNVEDTDISSFDGERSDASSSLGGGPTKKRDSTCAIPENFRSPVGSNTNSVGSDGVVLPWLQWETSNDGFLMEKNNKLRTPITQKSLQWDAEQDIGSGRDLSAYSVSSHGSWTPGLINDHHYLMGTEDSGEKVVDCGSHRKACFEMSDYVIMYGRKEEALCEMYNQRRRIASGGLLLCANIF